MTSTPLTLEIPELIELIQEYFCEIGVLMTMNTKYTTTTFPVEWLECRQSDDGDSLYLEDMADHEIIINISEMKSIVASDSYETGEKVTSVMITFDADNNLVIDIVDTGDCHEE